MGEDITQCNRCPQLWNRLQAVQAAGGALWCYVLGSQQMLYETLAQFDLLMKFALGQTGRLRQITNVATCP